MVSIEVYLVTECFGFYSHDDGDWWWWWCDAWADFGNSEEVHMSIPTAAGRWTLVAVAPDLVTCNTTGEFTLEPDTRYTWELYDFPLRFDQTTRACE